jgi:hypothetical protein
MRGAGFGIRGSGIAAILAVGFVGPAIGAPSESTSFDGGQKTELRINVRVQDYAQVPPKIWTEAKREASTILQETGVEFTWADCPVSGPSVDPVCAQPFAATHIALRILPKAMTDRAPLADDAFGYAAISTDERASFLASVFFERVWALSQELGYSRSATLGYVMAHEIGHLLLRTSGHSPFGIMRPRLTREDLLRPLRFNADQVEFIRTDVRVRTASASVARVVTTAPE